MGLFDGQVVIMIHSGSRAWGGAVSQYCSTDIAKMMRQEGIGTADPKLLYAPLSHPLGQTYVNLMYSALNYAVVNRHLIAYAALEAGKDVFGSKFELRTLYDLMHNYAWEEEQDEQSYFIHRKGATRALPQDIRITQIRIGARGIRRLYQDRWALPRILWSEVLQGKRIIIPSVMAQDESGHGTQRSSSYR